MIHHYTIVNLFTWVLTETNTLSIIHSHPGSLVDTLAGTLPGDIGRDSEKKEDLNSEESLRSRFLRKITM